jgi:hypothetical protein
MPTLNLQVGVSAGDAEGRDDGNSFNAGGSINRMIASSNTAVRFHFGAHYPSLAIPAGSTITSAIGQIYPYATSTDDAMGVMRMEKVVSALNFADNAAITAAARPRTTAGTAWEQADIPINQFQPTPDFAAAVQEVIDQPGWASGNGACVLYTGKTSGAGELRARSWDHTNAFAPKFDVVFTAPGGGDQIFRSTDKGVDRGADRGIN